MKFFVLLFLLFAGCATQPARTPASNIWMVTRAQWNAKPVGIGLNPQTPNEIIVHHSGEMKSPKSLPIKMRALQNSPLAQGAVSMDVPYHFFVDDDGTVGEGRPVDFAADPDPGYDVNGKILITLEGNFDQESPSIAQMDSLYKLSKRLMAQYHITRFTSHSDYTKIACPGAYLQMLMPQVRARLLYKPSI